jgi:alkanesulfonate monooxygenase SsuD/methylene tetrahydromethanopterin reductase-like flavin-dependent oxidoreductase (luciferase family)
MQVGVHLPQLALAGDRLSTSRLLTTVEAARRLGCAAVSANDHLDFAAPWLDGLVALAAAAPAAGDLELMTSVALPGVRGPAPLAAALSALSLIADGRVVAGVGPGSSAADQQLVGQDVDDRWRRFDASVASLKELLDESRPSRPATTLVAEQPIPVWVASWGSPAGLRRVARLGDGWVASAYNTTPEVFAIARERLQDELAGRGRTAENFPHALVTMWVWITDDDQEARRLRDGLLAPLLRRDPEDLAPRVCIGSAEQCADLIGRYAEAGLTRLHVWPLADETAQLQRLMAEVLPRSQPSLP